MRPATALFWTRLVHTAVWAVMAAAIVMLPVLAAMQRFTLTLAVTGMIALEGVALGLSGGQCPLTGVARRYTTESGPAFDIFLPTFLARWNKAIFSTLFGIGELVVIWALVSAGEHTTLGRHLAVLGCGAAATALAFLWSATRRPREARPSART